MFVLADDLPFDQRLRGMRPDKIGKVCTSWAGLRPSSSSVGGADRGVLFFVVDAIDIGFDQVVENAGLQRVIRVICLGRIFPPCSLWLAL